MRIDGWCRSCSAGVRWAVTTKGVRMPLDPQPAAGGNVIVVSWQRGRKIPVPVVDVGGDLDRAVTPYRYVSHFATCPAAGQWRRKR